MAKYVTYCCEHGQCAPVFSCRDCSEVQELRYEHAESIKQFEALVPEVIEEYWASGMDLLAYLEGPLAERLDRILEAELKNDGQYTDLVFQNMGVRLESEVEEIADDE
jgi:short subunit dehydrogenase-like uncharacterized protein